MSDWEFSSPLLAAKRRTLLDPAFMVCVMGGMILPSPSPSAQLVLLHSIHPIPALAFEDLAAGERSHALPHWAGSAKLATVSFNFCCRWLAFPFSLQSHGTFLIIKGF